MKIRILLLLAVIGLGGCQAHQYQAHAQPAHALTAGEGFTDPLGFHDPAPMFSWKLPGDVKKQSAYQIEVRSGQFILWQSGWVESDQTTFVPYQGKPLTSRQQVEWRVQFRDENGKAARWSEPGYFELGLLSSADWKAKWIRPQTPSDPNQESVAYLRHKFAVNRACVKARLYVTARGLFELELNGLRVGHDHFANGWTSYRKRIDVLTYDITPQLRSGDNTIQAAVAKGWYAGRIGSKKKVGLYGHQPELLLQMEIAYSDGASEIIVSDETWEGTWEGPIICSSIYDGEKYDARKQICQWGPVAANADLGPSRLMPKPFPPVRNTAILDVQRITEPQPGRFVFDLGQNMVGRARIKIPIEKDQTVLIRFAEMLNQDGTLYTANYRSAKSTDSYTAATTGTVEWEPSFTFHGFRYVELSGLPGGCLPKKEWISGVVLHSDLPKIGTFETSHKKLNQLQSNIAWGQRGNFLDIPTDCPQRDERLGWTGDAQVFCPTAMFNFDCHAFWKSWLASMRDDQMPDGRIPHVIPDALKRGGSPGWMDAAAIIPWEVYIRTGDTGVLAANFEMMERLVAWYRSQAADGLIPKITAYGDWLQPYAKNTRGDTPHALLATAFYAHSTRLLADAAAVLKRDDDAKRYSAEAESIKKAFANHYFDADAKLRNAPETQTGYLLAIAFNLIGPQEQIKAVRHLVRLVHEADNHLRTGFLGTPYITAVLDKMGYSDLAFDVLLKETYPSWFYSINQGATTMWERWNSFSHEKGFGSAQMNSFNHYAYGAIGQWMYERIAGLSPDPAQPGYKHFFVRPLVGKQLDWACAELETPFGTASSGWRRQNGKICMDVVVPPNTTATIEFPDGSNPQIVTAGTYHFITDP
ncbi:MAG: glycoside hydrolase family 78 protein [Planctomycetaceae bacterium]|nr:glycoside hydrolase family 78 protein [Planctomycetaceae bacterium]